MRRIARRKKRTRRFIFVENVTLFLLLISDAVCVSLRL
jgi:hypothetical protein